MNTSAENHPQGIHTEGISFTLGHPARRSLPITSLQAATSTAFQDAEALTMLEYAPERGVSQLIQHLVHRFNHEENLGITAENLMIVAGSTHAIDMIGRLYVGAGEVVLIEAPSYRDAIHIFRDHQIELHAVPMDENGIVVEALTDIVERLHSAGKPPRLFYTVPNFQNPTGLTTSEERRAGVIALSQRYNFIIVEDDVYRDIVFEGSIPPSYFTLADGQRVLRIGSFSKTLAPGLRLGWLIGDPDLLEGCLECGTTQMGGGANPFTSFVVATFCESVDWNTHLAELRQIYRERRDHAIAALEREMSPEVQWTNPAGGFFLWLTIPSRMTVNQLLDTLHPRGVFISPGTGFFANPDEGKHHLRLAYSFAELDEIDKGIRILADAINGISR